MQRTGRAGLRRVCVERWRVEGDRSDVDVDVVLVFLGAYPQSGFSFNKSRFPPQQLLPDLILSVPAP